jgi:hypothetical protein
MAKDIKVGDTVKVRGFRSNIDARSAAVGEVKHVDYNFRQADIDAGIQGGGLVALKGIQFSAITVISRKEEGK